VRSRPLVTFTVNDALEVAVPFGVVTLTLPVVALAGTLVEMCVESVTEKVAAVPLNFTLVAPVKPVPVMVTPVPDEPLVGVKLEIVGAAGVVTVKLLAEVAVPFGVVTLILPVEAPLGTVVVI
jgi:hypothetical protein